MYGLRHTLTDVSIRVPREHTGQSRPRRTDEFETHLIKALHLILWLMKQGNTVCVGAVQIGTGTSTTTSTSVSVPSSTISAGSSEMGCLRGSKPGQLELPLAIGDDLVTLPRMRGWLKDDASGVEGSLWLWLREVVDAVESMRAGAGWKGELEDRLPEAWGRAEEGVGRCPFVAAGVVSGMKLYLITVASRASEWDDPFVWTVLHNLYVSSSTLRECERRTCALEWS